ncbi:trypsin [Trichuris suis]|nr:trypsin [Trichuris suis]
MALWNHWALSVLIFPMILCLSEGTPCGIPKAYGGKQTEEYLRNDKLVFPWTVAIASNLGQFKCLGSIISEEGAPGSKKNSSSLVLTAGNCFRYNILKRWGSTSSFLVFAGVDRFRLFGGGAQKAYIKTIKIFQFATGNDNIWHGIALVTLKAPLMFSKLISPVCVAKQLVPPKSSRCFVSTYVKNQLDEEVVDLVPGALCDFGEFPELRSVGGICSIHQKADSERSFGGPLVCLVDGRAYQFGIYLSQLSVKEALFQNSALHYYGHSAKLFSNDPSISTYVIGLESKPSASKDATSKGCDKAESTLKETDNSCSLKPSKPTTPVDSAEQKGPALCGTTAIFGRTLESYIEGRTAQDMFPWNVFIVTKLRGTVKCIGSVIHAGKYEQHANASDVVLTAAQCFRQNAYTSAALTSSMSVYASSNKYSWFRGKGIKLSIVNIYPYGRGSVKGEAQNELALLKIQRPLSIQDKVIPVCLAPREELPPLESFCYVTHYDILEQRIDEDPVRLTHKRRCSLNQTQNEPNAEGLCTNEEKPKHYVQLGAPMVCIVNGRAYQYGVYLRQHNLQINQKVTQGLGFYCRISKIYDILDGKLVTPPRDNSITKPSEPSIPPTKLPSIFVPAVSTSQSSSSSNEKDATRPKPNVLTVLPSEPNSPSASNLHQGLVYPIKPATKGKSKSSSSSLSISKSRSSSSEQIKEEIEEEPALPEQPAIEQPVLKKNETTIVVKFPQLKYPKFVPKRESNEEPIIVSSVSSESKESEVPVIFPSVRPTPPHGDVPLAPLPSTPAPVKLESVSKSSSHSRSSSRSSMSGEVIKPAESDEISIPSPPLPSRPCELDTNNPNGVLICPGIRDDGKGITHTVPLPTPVPAAEYPSSSLESSERRIYPSIPEYDMTEQTIADHEHILVSDIAVHESAVAGATSTLCTINDDSFSSSQPSAIIGGITSGSNIYDSTGAAAVVSNSASGTHGSASLSGVSTSIGIIHGSASISSGAGLSVGRAHGSVGASSSGIRTSTGTTPGSKGASTGIRSGIGIHGSRGVSSSSSGIHTSIGAMHGSTDISSGVGTSVGRRSSSNCIRNAHGGRDSGNSLIKRLPGANAVHIFDVSQSSVEDVCTGSLHVKAGEVYSDIVLTSARCIWSRVSRKYKVYVGSLLPRHMTMAQFNRTLISVERIFTLPFYSGHSSLKAMGIGVLKLKHKVKVTAGVQSFPLPYPETAPTPRMECFVSGICQHGMPVRVAYQLLSPGDCRSQLGQQFLPSLQYCGIGRKDILKFPVGAPLLCHFFGNWTQFGIYDHPLRFAKPDHLGPGEEAHLNEIAVFTKLESDSVSGALKGL